MTEVSDNQREKELLRSILATPQGKELKEIWVRRLTRVKTFAPELPEPTCRYVSGRHSVYIDAIRASEN